MPATLTSWPQSHQQQIQSQPSWEWPEFRHPAPVTIASLALVLILVSISASLVWQIVRLRLAQRRGFILVSQQVDTEPLTQHQHKQYPIDTRKMFRPISTTSELEIETRQLLFPDRATMAERMPLCAASSSRGARGSLYDTFQIPHPHATRLKCSRSMMELNGGDPLEDGDDNKADPQKAKTIHWHGVNKLNTAWAWMS
ncbi:hypothetical protein BGZ63DRAFT_402644 [Mariannaea sp. PMI_226]|nr:hypothetical protein BGZ63DRAFT_402644 [Mariannaea sp. PMI_226]